MVSMWGLGLIRCRVIGEGGATLGDVFGGGGGGCGCGVVVVVLRMIVVG